MLNEKPSAEACKRRDEFCSTVPWPRDETAWQRANRIFALYLDEVSRAMTLLRKHIDLRGDLQTVEVFGDPCGKVVFDDFILPEPPDPGEEAWKEARRRFFSDGTVRQDAFEIAKQVFAERGLAIVKKETGDAG